ncbi:MAG: ATP-binding protein, partial [Armatimonadota bacterium]
HDDFSRHLFDTIRDGGSRSARSVRVVRKDGTTVPVDVSASVIDVGDGPIGLAILHDVSERVELERQRRIQAAELERRVRERTAQLAWLTSLNESIIESMPSPMLVLDTDLKILRADQKCLAEWEASPEEIEGKNLVETFPPEVLEQQGLLDAIHQVASEGGSREFDGVRWPDPTGERRLLNFRIRRVENGDAGQIILLWDDVTSVARRTYGLSLLYEIGQAMQRTRDPDRLLHAILTCVTAGPAMGLGLNRAFLLLIDEETGRLEGRMAVGPASADHAHRIWSDVAEAHHSLQDFLDAYREVDPAGMPLHGLVSKMSFSVDDGEQFIAEALATKQPIVISDAQADARVSEDFASLLGSNEFVAVPLVAHDNPLGLIIGDNLFSGRPITDEDLQLLAMFSAQAGIGLANAAAYRELELSTAELQQTLEQLEEAHESLVRAQQLAAVGEMSARVAHEIRNPLTTVGGFARTILREPGNFANTEQSANIIVEELDRLEQILDNLLYVARPRELRLAPTDVNESVEESCQLLRDSFDGATWRLKLDLSPDVPPTLADAGQLKQAFLNLAKNAVEAMPDGGRLTIRTRRQGSTLAIYFSDTGVGISEDARDEIFDLFFTTRAVGSGIGLFVTRQIIEEHGGSVHADNNPDVGATFTVHLPIREAG